MAVHNERDEYIKMALNSVFSQSYKNLEVIIVDDCCDAHCQQILSSYENVHSNMRIHHNNINLGLTKSLNIGLQMASGDFIARMDADDISLPDRIEKQLQFLCLNEDIDVCGTGVVSFGDQVIYMSPFRGLSNAEAQCYLFFSSTLCHPSVMIRKSFIDKYQLTYDETVLKGQDYDMWERCSVFGKLSVMKDVLLFYRVHSSQITSTKKSEQDYYADKTRRRRLSRIGLSPTAEEMECHMALAGSRNVSVNLTRVEEWKKKIIMANDTCNFVDRKVLALELDDRLVQYKLRKREYRLLIFDIYKVVKIIWARICMRVRLKEESVKLQKILADVSL